MGNRFGRSAPSPSEPPSPFDSISVCSVDKFDRKREAHQARLAAEKKRREEQTNRIRKRERDGTPGRIQKLLVVLNRAVSDTIDSMATSPDRHFHACVAAVYNETTYRSEELRDLLVQALRRTFVERGHWNLYVLESGEKFRGDLMSSAVSSFPPKPCRECNETAPEADLYTTLDTSVAENKIHVDFYRLILTRHYQPSYALGLRGPFLFESDPPSLPLLETGTVTRGWGGIFPDDECCICHSVSADVLFHACHHLCVCDTCCQAIRQCPKCRCPFPAAPAEPPVFSPDQSVSRYQLTSHELNQVRLQHGMRSVYSHSRSQSPCTSPAESVRTTSSVSSESSRRGSPTLSRKNSGSETTAAATGPEPTTFPWRGAEEPVAAHPRARRRRKKIPDTPCPSALCETSEAIAH